MLVLWITRRTWFPSMNLKSLGIIKYSLPKPQPPLTRHKILIFDILGRLEHVSFRYVCYLTTCQNRDSTPLVRMHGTEPPTRLIKVTIPVVNIKQLIRRYQFGRVSRRSQFDKLLDNHIFVQVHTR